MDVASPVLRRATPADVAGIGAVMQASIRDIFPLFYDARQTESSVMYIGQPDTTLIADGTYLVLQAADGAIVACGGWSRRDKLYTGSGDQEGRARLLDPASEPARVRAMFVREDWTRRGLGMRILDACESAARREGFHTLALMATLPGVPLYERFGFRILEHVMVTLPDGVELACISMEKRLGH
jgi:GNAT superfamily N-acetyltransferase